MKAAVLAIGTELTRGELCDTNTYWLSAQLTELGVRLVEHVCVDDDNARIAGALRRLCPEVELLVVTGGLGPTSDDRTAAAAAAAVGVPMVRDKDSLSSIDDRYRRAGRVMGVSDAKQADFPQGATPLANSEGTAPGFRMTWGSAELFFTPGVPREMRHIYTRHVVPFVEQRVRRTTEQVHLRAFGLPEPVAAERLADLEAGGRFADPRVTLGYRAGFPELEVKVLATGEDLETAKALARRYGELAASRLAPFVFGGRESTFPGAVGEQLRNAGVRVAAAESCTGGLVGKLLTDLPGSSDYFVGSAVAYHNDAKTALLGVEPATLARHGAVSAEVAGAMATGAVERFGVDHAVAITGIAGPGGGSADKPVGTVWFGVASRSGFVTAVQRRFSWDRDRVRQYTAYVALGLLRDVAVGQLEGQSAP